MKQSGHLNPSEKPELDDPSLQSMEGHLQTSMEVWVNNNNLIPESISIIRTAMNEAAETDQESTLSELEEILLHQKDTAPGVDTVCHSMIKNVPLSTRYLIIRLINQSFTKGRLPAA